MKPVPTWCIVVVFIISSYSSFAQQTLQRKSTLFSAYPSVIKCTEAQLNNLFKASTGQNTRLTLSDNFVLEGTVKTKTNKYGKIETISVQLPSFNNISLSISRRPDNQHRMIYTAHLFNRNFPDGYELKRIENNLYQFEKIDTEKMLPLCTQ